MTAWGRRASVVGALPLSWLAAFDWGFDKGYKVMSYSVKLRSTVALHRKHVRGSYFGDSRFLGGSGVCGWRIREGR